jgi:Arc/MetJ family transcription regulator
MDAYDVRTMRTTLTIDDDLAGLLKARARESGVSFKDAVNRTLRAGLGEDAAKARRAAAPKTVAHSFGFKAGVDLDKLGQLADELESEAYAATLAKAHDPSRRKRSRSRA